MDWKAFLLGENEWRFLFVTALRTLFMFSVLLFMLRLMGKKGIHQLSIFELGVIIGLGSAAGDPMFYKEVGVIPSVIVFAVVIFLYRFISYLMDKSDKLEHILEGRATYIIKDGKFLLENFKKEVIAREELFTILRQQQISHLGQVSKGILESSGHVSVFYYPDDQVKYGLTILPEDNQVFINITKQDIYSCRNCGETKELSVGKHACPVCEETEWILAVNELRIT